jgi:hypothetical protein
MLVELLQLLAEGGVHSYDEVAGRLSVSQALLEAVLEALARLGYVRLVENGCDRCCADCSIGGCSIAGPGRLWTLADKGIRTVARFSL